MSRRRGYMFLFAWLILTGNAFARGEQPVREAKPMAAEARKAVRTDLYDDALPEGALARFGTIYLKSNFGDPDFSDGKLAFRDDGREFYSWTQQGVLRVHDPATGKVLRAFVLTRPAWTTGKVFPLLWPFLGHHADAEFSANGHLLILAIPNEGIVKAITVWDTSTGKLFRRIDSVAGESFVYWQVCVRDGGTLVTRDSKSGAVRVWNLRNGTQRVLRKTSALAYRFHVSPDGKRLFVQLEDSIECWDMADGKRIWENRSQTFWSPVAPDGRALLVDIGPKARPHFLDPATGKAQSKLKPPPWNDVRNKWGADSKTFLLPGADDKSLLVWDLVAGKERARFPCLYDGVMAPDGKSILVASAALQRWELETKKPLYPNIAARGHLQAVASLALSSDGKTLVSADKSGDLHFWDSQTSRLIRVVRKMNAAALAFSPDGKRLLVVTPDKSLLVCDPGSGKVLDKWALYGLPTEVPGIDGMTISDENKLVINQCDPGSFMPKARLALPAPGGVTAEWDIKTRKRLWFRTLEGEDAFLALSPDGRLGVDWAMILREAKSGRLVGHLGEKDDRDYVLPSGIFSPDGSLIATETHRLSSSAKSTNEAKYTGVKIWESATCRLLQRLPLHVSGELALAPDGRRLAILRADQLWIWDIVRGKELLHLQAPVSAAYWRGTKLAFTQNGRGLVVATEDGSMLLFEVPPIASAGLAHLTEAQLRTTWEFLTDPDSAKAFAAVADLADRANEAVPFLNNEKNES